MLNDPHELIKLVNQNGGAYHKLVFPDGTILNGVFDMSKYLDYFKIPESLEGKSVLEIGTATGFFALELAKRNPKKIVAIDKYVSNIQFAANQLMGTKVEFIQQDFNLLGEKFGKFDLVLCSNVLQHISDMFGMIEKIKKITNDMAILCTDILPDELSNIPVAHFFGDVKTGIEGEPYWSYWQPNSSCFKKMVEVAGFSKAKIQSQFMLESEDKKMKIRDAVIHAYV